MQDPRSVDKLRHGDVTTLKSLFKANYAKLYPMAFRLTRDRAAAGLVIRNAFKQLWSERADLDRFESVDTRLVRHTYLEAVRYREENEITGFSVNSDPERTGEDGVAELADIPDDDQLKYLLFVVDGYSFRELARAFDVSEEDIQLSVGRALTKLKEVLATS